jgi:hypothetical protein
LVNSRKKQSGSREKMERRRLVKFAGVAAAVFGSGLNLGAMGASGSIKIAHAGQPIRAEIAADEPLAVLLGAG